MLRKMFVVGAALAAVMGTTTAANAEVELKFGTLAPKDSTWGKVFSAWAGAIAEESHGELKMTWYWNGQQGDEIAMVGHMRDRTLDGAAITATGLSQIYPHIHVLQLPGVFPTWDKLDKARKALSDHFDTAFDAQGFKILGVGDVGMAHLMSKGGPVRVPEDLGKMKPFFIAGDVVGQTFLQQVPGVTNMAKLTVPEILPALGVSVNVINTPAIVAEQLQWASKLDNINTMPTGIGVGALVFHKGKLAGLPPDVKAVLFRTGETSGKLLTQRIRNADAAAFERLKGRMTVYNPTPADQAQWAALFEKTRSRLKQGSLDPHLVDRAVTEANK